jgi:ADP-heptose:LPS heptosyltransferase
MTFKIHNSKNVLVLMLDKHMGDLILSLPSIDLFNRFFKQNIHLVVDSGYREIIEMIYGLQNVLYYPRKQLKESSLIKRAYYFLQFLRSMRKAKPEIAIDLEGRNLSSTLTFLSGASLRVSRDGAARSFLYNHTVSVPAGEHKMRTYTEIASSLGIDAGNRVFSPHISAEKKNNVINKLLSNGATTERPIVCIHPCAGKIYKQWTVEGFVEISDWLSDQGCQVVLVGGEADIPAVNSIVSLSGETIYTFAGRLSLGELAALFAQSALYIGNDSGPMHLAAISGIPVIALFGPASEKRWGPLSEKSIALRGESRCESCAGKDCAHDFKCIRNISPDDVKSAVRKLMELPGETRMSAS